MKEITTIKHNMSLIKSVLQQSFNEGFHKDYWFTMSYLPKPGNEKLLGREMRVKLSDGTIAPYYFNTAACEKYGSPVAVSVQLYNRFTHKYEIKIFVDDLFLMMPKSTQKFIIAHEYGHIKFDHLNGSLASEEEWCNSHGINRENLFNPPFTAEKQLLLEKMCHDIRNIKYEYEADKYAADQVGKFVAIAAIEKVRDTLPKELLNSNAEDEFNMRIDMLYSTI